MLPKKRLRRFSRRHRYWVWYLQKEQKERNASGDYCNDGIVTNGCFFEDLSGWTASQWEWQEEGVAAPIHLTANSLSQAISMEAGQRIVLQFSYNLESGATLYLKVGGAVNDIVIAGPATDTYIGVEAADGDTLTFAISSAANPSNNWIDDVRVEAYVWRPDAFSFQDQVDVEPLTLTTSFPVVIEGMLDDCPVSVTDGEYDINQSDVWTAADGTINSGDLIRVRRQSGDYSSAVGVVFRAGNRTDVFNIATRAKDETPDPFTFTAATDVEPNTLTTSDPVTISGMDDGCPVAVTDGEYDINQSGTWTTNDGVMDSGDQIRLRRLSGSYSNTVGVTFTAGTQLDTFNITTKADPDPGGGAQRPDGGPAQRPDGGDAVLPGG